MSKEEKPKPEIRDVDPEPAIEALEEREWQVE
jgi:hypothetical protein